ncbi:MAG: flagellar basal body L-ring protein, partial [Gammaproteobacteria bacterium]|nr:flagellar basal body L-ring protein [Gammaproteobacteria bacterium]
MKHCIPVLMIALSGCAARPLHSNDEPAALGTDVVATASHGAIYRDGRDLRLFEHYVARGVGDVLTVRLAETTDASKSASTSTKKSAKADLPGPLIGGRPV